MKKQNEDQPGSSSFDEEMEIFEELEADDGVKDEKHGEDWPDEKTPIEDLKNLDLDEPTPMGEAGTEDLNLDEPPAAEESAPRASAAESLAKELLDMSPDIPVNLVAVIGKTTSNVGEVMKYRIGSVIDLKRPPNETVDLVANGRLIARGELVEMDGKLGVKVIKLVR